MAGRVVAFGSARLAEDLPAADLGEVMRSGTLRQQLTAMRDFLASQITHAPYREVAPIAAQLRQILVDLEQLPLDEGESSVARIAREREARQARAVAQMRTGV